MNKVQKVTEKYLKPNVPEFRVGDAVRVDVRVVEGKRERIQSYEGVVVAKASGGISETFTVRKVSGGVGVERTFPVHSPKLEDIVVVKKGKVRRAKLNFIKKMSGQYKIKERG